MALLRLNTCTPVWLLTALVLVLVLLAAACWLLVPTRSA
jgi:hypothetical protein